MEDEFSLRAKQRVVSRLSPENVVGVSLELFLRSFPKPYRLVQLKKHEFSFTAAKMFSEVINIKTVDSHGISCKKQLIPGQSVSNQYEFRVRRTLIPCPQIWVCSKLALEASCVVSTTSAKGLERIG